MGSVLTSAREIRELTEIPTNIAALARLLMEAQEQRRLLRSLAEAESTFGVDAAHRALEEVSVHRRADGWRQLGWKIGGQAARRRSGRNHGDVDRCLAGSCRGILVRGLCDARDSTAVDPLRLASDRRDPDVDASCQRAHRYGGHRGNRDI